MGHAEEERGRPRQKQKGPLVEVSMATMLPFALPLIFIFCSCFNSSARYDMLCVCERACHLLVSSCDQANYADVNIILWCFLIATLNIYRFVLAYFDLGEIVECMFCRLSNCVIVGIGICNKLFFLVFLHQVSFICFVRIIYMNWLAVI